MQDVECLACMFSQNQVEPIHQSVIHALVCAEARHANAAVSESPLFGWGQVQRRGEDAGFISRR